MVYTSVGRDFADHSVVTPSAKQYDTTAGFEHANTAETFCSSRECGVIGTY
jgi:hypothetical protein